MADKPKTRIPLRTPLFNEEHGKDLTLTRQWAIYLGQLLGASDTEGAAPNITATVTSVTYKLAGHFTIPVFNGVITLPTTDADYINNFNVVLVFAVNPTSGEEFQIGRFPKPSGSTISYSASSDQVRTTATAQTGWTIRFKVYDLDYAETGDPFEVTGVTIGALTVPTLSGADSTADRWADINRSVYAPQAVTITCSVYPAIVTLWINDGANKWQGWFTINGATTLKLGLRGSPQIIFAPRSAATWTVKAAIGAWEGNDTDGWKNGDTGVGPVAIASVPTLRTSSGYSVSGMGLPSATDITDITFAAGAGGSFPYNKLTPDGEQYWSITSITFNTATAFADPNVFCLNVTCQDLDGSGNPCGPEHIYGTPVPGPSTVVMGPLEGPYGSNADPARTASIGGVRVRVYLVNRFNQTGGAWLDTTNSARLQTLTSTLGYKDFVVAVAGALPPGAIVGNRVAGAVNNAVHSLDAQQVPGSGITGAINLGGGGALTTIANVKNAAGTVIGWWGQSGSDYGLYTQNLWVGANGPGPLGAKLWIDTGGNIHMLGSIETGSGITITTLNGTVSISGTTPGLLVSSGGFTSYMQGGLLGISNGASVALFGPSGISVESIFFTVGLYSTGFLVINSSRQFVGQGVNCPSFNVSCGSLTIGASGITVPGGHSNSGQSAVAVKDSLGAFCHLVVNGVDLGAVRFNFQTGIFCGLV